MLSRKDGVATRSPLAAKKFQIHSNGSTLRTLRKGVDDVTAPDGIEVPRWVCEDPRRRTVMSEIITVGLDLAKNVFQAHGADASGRAIRGSALDDKGQPSLDEWLGQAHEPDEQGGDGQTASLIHLFSA